MPFFFNTHSFIDQQQFSKLSLSLSLKESPFRSHKHMTCILSCSHGVVIATAMVFSSTALFLAISRQFSGTQTSVVHDQQLLRSCLSSEEKRKQRKKIYKKKKKVKFAENVKEPKGNGEEYRKERLRRIVPETMTKPEKTSSVCRKDMPANRIALYNGILRDRDYRIQCSY